MKSSPPTELLCLIIQWQTKIFKIEIVKQFAVEPRPSTPLKTCKPSNDRARAEIIFNLFICMFVGTNRYYCYELLCCYFVILLYYYMLLCHAYCVVIMLCMLL